MEYSGVHSDVLKRIRYGTYRYSPFSSVYKSIKKYNLPEYYNPWVEKHEASSVIPSYPPEWPEDNIKYNVNLYKAKYPFESWCENVLGKYYDKKEYFRSFGDFFVLTCLMYTNCDADILLESAKFVTWYFPLDDIILEKFQTAEDGVISRREFFKKFHEIINGNENSSSSTGMNIEFAKILADIFLKLEKRLSEKQKKFYAETFEEYYDASVIEAAFRTRKQPIPFDLYMLIRRTNVGVFPLLFFAQFDCNVDMTFAYDDQTFWDMQISVVDALIALNDAYSFAKDIAKRETMNLVFILKENSNIHFEDCIEILMELYNEAQDNFDKYAQILIERYSNRCDVKSYISSVKNIFTANVLYHKFSHRYMRHFQDEKSREESK